MNILIIGFGNMGCRHAQSFLHDTNYQVSVIEPNDIVFNTNLTKIGGTKDSIKRITFAECQKGVFDFAVIATSADVRYSLFEKLLNIGIKTILLEKVVFQSPSQFNDALNLVNTQNTSVYCNFINRYSNSYSEIKNLISGPIDFTVTGGHFGFACNALHYIDLFKYFVENDIKLIMSNLKKSDKPNVRGEKFVEVFGQQIWATPKGDRLFISSDPDNNAGKGCEIQIRFNGKTFIINENTSNQINIFTNGKIDSNKFDLPMSSKLTNSIFEDIKSGAIKLPNLKETMSYHIEFFESINKCLGLLNNDCCPIT